MLKWYEMKDCPFCNGEVVDHPHNDSYFICIHKPYCFMLNKSSNIDKQEKLDFTLIPKTERYITEWNRRDIGW